VVGEWVGRWNEWFECRILGSKRIRTTDIFSTALLLRLKKKIEKRIFLRIQVGKGRNILLCWAL